MREAAREPFGPPVIKPAQIAIHLPQRLTQLRRRFGIDQIGDGLGFGEVEFAVLKSPPRKLARLGHAEMRHLAQTADHGVQNGPPAVQMKFGHILAGKTVRRGKPQDESAVDDVARRLNDGAQRRDARFRSRAGRAQRLNRPRRPRPRNTHHRHPRPPRRGGQSKDGGQNVQGSGG